MTYVRISLMKPLSRRPLEVEKLNRELVQLYRKQEGCISGHLIGAAPGSGEVGRVSFWQSESAADAPATSDQSLSLRSRLHLLVKRGHQDTSFDSSQRSATGDILNINFYEDAKLLLPSPPSVYA